MALLVFASGCSALVFQVAWMRELRLVFGATTASVAAVLAIFMAGLGVGSAILGKRADRVKNPLFMYGVLEAAIALSVAVTPWLIKLVSSIYIGLGGQESLGLTGATIVRLVLATTVMAVPAFLMGGTLPAAVRAVTSSADVHRRALGVLYGSNTLGAVFGTAAATFFALENLGTRATLWTGCALGLLVGAIAIKRSDGLPPLGSQNQESPLRPPISDPAAKRSAGAEEADLALHPRFVYLAAAVLGFAFFALELVWYRMLAPILGGTAFTFGLILCIALLGIGLGGIAYNTVFRRLRPTASALAITCACEAAFTMIPYALGDRLAMLAAWKAETARTFSQLVLGWSYVAGIVVLPVAIVAGLQFPLLTALLGRARQAVSKHLGMTYAWNTMGAIAGSLIAGFGGMPLLSAPGLWQAIALLLAVLSIGILFATREGSRRSLVVVAALVLVAVGSMFAQGPTAAWRHGGIGAGRAVVPPYSNPNGIQQWLNEKRHAFVWEADGIESTVAIDAHNGYAFVVNGKSDGNALTDAATQIGVSILGAVLHKDPKTALVIGLGTGESAGWLAEMRGIERVDVVELEPAIDEMASRCRDVNFDVLNHPRVRRIYNDGREYVLTTDQKYDVIISEPSNPYRAGVAALYTTEFYQAVRERLNPGGLFIQWLQAYEVDEFTVSTVLATVGSEFDHVEVWQTLAADLQLVCSNTPIEYSVEELRERISTGTVQEALAKAWAVNDLEGFLAHFAASSQWADELVQSPILTRNTDDRTILEYTFAKTVGRRTPFSVEAVRERVGRQGFHRPSLSGGAVDWDLVELRRQQFNLLLDGQLSLALTKKPADQALVEAFNSFRNNDFAAAIEHWPAEYREPKDNIERLILARCYAELARPECLDLLRAAKQQFPAEAAAVEATYHWRKGEIAAATEALERFFAVLAENPWCLATFTDAAFSRTIDVAKADATAARRLYQRLSQPFASLRFDYVRCLARVMVAQRLDSKSVVEAFAALEPHVTWTAEILEARAKAYADTGHPLAAKAERDWQRYQQHQTAK